MKSRYLNAIVFAAVLGLLGSTPLRAQATQENTLSTLKTLSCVFPLSVSASWKEGEPQAAIRTGGVLTQRIINIDTADGSAKLDNGTGEGHMVAQLSGWNLHFLEMQPAGALAITTVFAQESKTGKLKAVQTRTDYLPVNLPRYQSTPIVTQYDGECESVK